MLSLEKTLFLHTGWTERYGGDPDDSPVGGHSYLNEIGEGHEAWNFLPMDGKCSGYAPVRGGTINITQLGASALAPNVDEITVVWTATKPSGGRAIVGWYRNATVFRHAEKRERGRSSQWTYSVIADELDCVLVPAAQRVFDVPTASEGHKDFPGNQAASWFPGTKQSRQIPKWIARVSDYLGSFERATRRGGRRFRQPDIEKRRAVEDAAMTCVQLHFESRGYKVINVSAENRGWDLEAKRKSEFLLLEVKGLSGTETIVELTPNEYINIKNSRPTFRLCIVTSALHTPELAVYSWTDHGWRSENRTLQFQELLAARAFLTRT